MSAGSVATNEDCCCTGCDGLGSSFNIGITGLASGGCVERPGFDAHFNIPDPSAMNGVVACLGVAPGYFAGGGTGGLADVYKSSDPDTSCGEAYLTVGIKTVTAICVGHVLTVSITFSGDAIGLFYAQITCDLDADDCGAGGGGQFFTAYQYAPGDFPILTGYLVFGT